MRYIFLLSWLFHACSGALTLEEKVGQLLIVHFNGTEANEEARTYIQDLHVGGFIYYNFANELDNPDQIRKLSTGLQELAQIPLWITVDQEGGPVVRLSYGFSTLPGNREIAATGNPHMAYAFAKQMGIEMKAVGINMNLAPVIDVSSDPTTSVMARRSYGDVPEIVIDYAGEALRGYAEAGIIAVLKHFPGYGNAEADPHAALSINPNPLSQLESIDLMPFRVLAPFAPAMMTAHIKVPALDPDHCATLSKKIITDFLRNDIGYNGLVITDSLAMRGLLDDCSNIEVAAIQAINAGCDLLILGGKQLHNFEKGLEFHTDVIHRIHQAIVSAVQSGTISEARLEESISRILSTKKAWIFKD